MRTIRLQDVADDTLRDMWLSEQIPYRVYVDECERRGIRPWAKP